MQDILLLESSIEEQVDKCIIGTTESGKSFIFKGEMINHILWCGDVTIIDPEQKYEKFINKLNI